MLCLTDILYDRHQECVLPCCRRHWWPSVVQWRNHVSKFRVYLQNNPNLKLCTPPQTLWFLLTWSCSFSICRYIYESGQTWIETTTWMVHGGILPCGSNLLLSLACIWGPAFIRVDHASCRYQIPAVNWLQVFIWGKSKYIFITDLMTSIKGYLLTLPLLIEDESEKEEKKKELCF